MRRGIQPWRAGTASTEGWMPRHGAVTPARHGALPGSANAADGQRMVSDVPVRKAPSVASQACALALLSALAGRTL